MFRFMKPLLLLAAALCLSAVPVRADDHDEEDGTQAEQEVETIRGGPRGDDDAPRGRMGGGMGRMTPRGRMGKRGGEPEPDPAMKEKFEAMQAAQDKVRELTKKLRKAKDSEKAALKKDAKAALERLFDARLAMEQSMVDKMSEHLAEKKEKLAKKKAAKDKLIEERLDKLTGDAPSWDD